MKFFLIISFLIPYLAFCDISDKLTQKILDCEIAQSKLSPMLSLDCYTYFYIEGVKTGYLECLRLIASEKLNE